jgi:membrane-associated phospholipid phosphatase
MPLINASPLFWSGFTRLGEAQILLPAALAAYGWTIWRAPASRACATRWLGWVALAAVLTTATKVAFMGWGIGSARWDFTGLSGHAMFAAAILPVLMRLLTVDQPPPRVAAAVAIGYGLAWLVAASRVQVDAHSVSEVIGGALCGSAASAVALMGWRHLPARRVPMALWLGVPLAIALAMHSAPPSPTHGLVIRLSLHLSGRPVPCTREALHQDGCTLRAALPAALPQRWLRPPSIPGQG